MGFKHRAIYFWVLDFDNCQITAADSIGARKAVKVSFKPRPDVQDRILWSRTIVQRCAWELLAHI